MQRSIPRAHGSLREEIPRKAVHAGLGVFIVLLFHAEILSLPVYGLLTIVLGAAVFYNYTNEKELLMRVISINRPDAKVPGLDILAYFISTWLVLWLFPLEIAFAAIMILAFGDPLAHLVSRSFGATKTVVTPHSYRYGFLAGTLGGALAAWIPGYASLLPAIIASALAMFIEAGELRIAEHHIDDNFTIPIVAALVLWVIASAF